VNFTLRVCLICIHNLNAFVLSCGFQSSNLAPEIGRIAERRGTERRFSSSDADAFAAVEFAER